MGERWGGMLSDGVKAYPVLYFDDGRRIKIGVGEGKEQGTRAQMQVWGRWGWEWGVGA